MCSLDLIDEYKNRIHEVFDEAYSLFLKKIPDYEDVEHPLRTFRLSKDLNIEPWEGCLLRMGDKISLLYTYVRDGKFLSHDEDCNETILDIIIYAAFTYVLFDMRDELEKLSMDSIIEKIKEECLRKNK